MPGKSRFREAGKPAPLFADLTERAEWIRAHINPPTIETEPHRIATGILDDETYDWLAITRAFLMTGGTPLVVAEATLAEATRLAKSEAGIAADATGASGLAGAIDLARRAAGPSENIAVLVTGVER